MSDPNMHKEVESLLARWSVTDMLVFGSWRGGGFSNIYVQDANGTVAERLTESSDMQLPTSVTPDGRAVVFHTYMKSIEELPLQAPRTPRTLVGSALEERNAVVSPDGRWLTYEAQSSASRGEVDVYVRTFSGQSQGIWQVTLTGGAYPIWAPNGRTLFYATFDGTVYSVPFATTTSGWHAGKATRLFKGPYAIRGIEGSQGRHFDVSSDGRRFLMLKDAAPTTTTGPHFVVVQNWATELQQRVR